VNRLPIEGESFGRYRLLRLLGRGGMGVVYAAHDTSLDREVAVKLVLPHLAGDDEFRARFQHEASVLAKLESPRIVRIYDHGEHDGTLFLVTQLVAGGDLRRLIDREGALPPALALDVLAQMTEGLCDAHAVGVTHRDIKPANVLLRERGGRFEAFLCDFGIATTPGTELSRTGSVTGSLPYMAPERYRGEDAGPQSDIYPAGCLLWHAFTGSAPYAGTDVEIAVAHIQAPVPQLPGKDEFTKRANAVLTRAMAKDRSKRYPTARALLTELQALARIAPDAITLPGATAIRHQVPGLPGPRSRWRAAGVAVLAVLAVVASATVARSTMANRDTAESPDAVVTETISPTRSSSVGPTPTLRRGAVTTTRGGELVTHAPVAGAAESDVPGTSGAAPQPGRTLTVSAPAPTGPRYRCWDGTVKSSLEQCGLPSGTRGLRYVFLSGRSLACSSSTATSPRVSVLTCQFSGSSGSGQVALAQYSSVQDAYAGYQRWYPHDAWTWFHDGWDYGWGWTGQIDGSRPYKTTRLYRAGPYVATVHASSKDARKHGLSLINWRSPSDLAGVRE